MNDIVSIKRVFSIINSCNNINQIEGCKNLIKSYRDLVRKKGVINYDLVYSTLEIKVKEKEAELELELK